MSTTAWIAGSVRARALSRRRVGAARARQIAACRTTAEAVAVLATSPYGHDVHSGQDHAGAEWGIGATLLWHLRVLAGWLPPGGVGPVRVLAGGFELANIDEHLQSVEGRPAAPAYRLGALATAWNRLASTAGPDAMRRALAASPWGDPGCSDPRGIAIGVRLGWAERVLGAVPAAGRWAAGAVALLAAREVAGGRRLPDASLRRAEALLGAPAVRQATLPAFVAALPARARWVFGDDADPADLWRAGPNWWRRVERDGHALLTTSQVGPRVVLGTVAVLAADARRARAALACAARGGAVEVFDEVA
jgi:hypothetical protein